MTITTSAATSTFLARGDSDCGIGDFHEFIETEHHTGQL